MDEGTQGIFAFILISVIVSVTAHALVRSYPLAVVVAAISSSVIFNVLASIKLGHPDKFIVLVLMITTFLGCVTAAVVGVPFYVSRNEKKGTGKAPPASKG